MAPRPNAARVVAIRRVRRTVRNYAAIADYLTVYVIAPNNTAAKVIATSNVRRLKL